MHPRHPGMHIAIDSYFLIILSFELKFFVCRHVSMCEFRNCVCPYPKKRNYPSFVNQSYSYNWYASTATAWEPKYLIFLKKNMLTWMFLLSCFVISFQLILCTLVGLFFYAISKHSSRSQHISVLTTCTFMFRQFCTIEPSFFNATSGMHRRPIEGRHLVW